MHMRVDHRFIVCTGRRRRRVRDTSTNTIVIDPQESVDLDRLISPGDVTFQKGDPLSALLEIRMRFGRTMVSWKRCGVFQVSRPARTPWR
jgi:hypothetical protein